MPRIAVVGSTNIDLTFRVARLPRPGETVPGIALPRSFGGKGANQAVLAARLGATVAMISAIGDDAAGREAIENFRAQGVDATHVRAVPGPTGTAAIVVDDSAENTIVVAPGANDAVTAEQVRHAEGAIRSADVVLAQMETPAEATVEAFRLARGAGVKTLLNPAPARPLSNDLLARTDLVVPNETELAALTGLPVGNDEEVRRAAEAMKRAGAKAVLVTCGDRGAILLDEAFHVVPSVAVEAVDPTAAGDAFIGALAVFIAGRRPLVEAIRRACVVAALTVTRPGAQDSFPVREEIEAFLARHGV